MGMIGNTLAQGLISGANIQDGTVDTPDLKDSAVTAAKIATGTITPNKLSTGAPTWDTSGNVGLGIASPSAQLHLYKNATSATNIYLQNASTSAGSYATLSFDAGAVTTQLFADAGGGVYAQGAVLRTTSNHPLILGTNNLERIRVDGSGNVGFNTTSPSTTRGPLTVLMPSNQNQSGIVIRGANSGGSGSQPALTFEKADGSINWSIYADQGTNYLAINSGSTERVRLDSGGRAGFGITSPSAQVHIANATGNYGLGTDNTGMLLIESTYSSAGSNTNASLIAKNYYGLSQFLQWENNGVRIGSRVKSNGGGGAVVFTYGNDTEGARIDSNGNSQFKGYVTHHSSNSQARPIHRIYGLPVYTYNSGGNWYNTTVRIGRFASNYGRLRCRIVFAGDFNYASFSAELTLDMKAWSGEPGNFCFAGKEIMGFVSGQFATDTDRYIYFQHGYLWSQDCALIVETEEQFEWAIASFENYHSVTRPWRGVGAGAALQYEVSYGS